MTSVSDAATQPVKAELEVEVGDPFEFLFNPAELSISKSNTWEAPAAKGRNAPKLRFQGGGAGSLSFTATFDTTHDGSDVTEHTNRLLALMRTNEQVQGSDKQRNKARPPWVRFRWGHLQSFKAVIESLSVSFTYFASDGTALRAVADMTLKQFEDETTHALQNPTSHTPAPRRVHRLQPGETLDRLAGVYYGDATRWRRIARANGIADPLALVPGIELAIPEPEVVSRA
jgi:hypothetical protein